MGGVHCVVLSACSTGWVGEQIHSLSCLRTRSLAGAHSGERPNCFTSAGNGWAEARASRRHIRVAVVSESLSYPSRCDIRVAVWQAIDELTHALSLSPHNPELWLLRSECYVAKVRSILKSLRHSSRSECFVATAC